MNNISTYRNYVLERARNTYGLATKIDELETQLLNANNGINEIIKETLLKDAVSISESGNQPLLEGLEKIYGVGSRATFCRLVKQYWGSTRTLAYVAMQYVEKNIMIIDRADYSKIVESISKLSSKDETILEIKAILERMNTPR